MQKTIPILLFLLNQVVFLPAQDTLPLADWLGRRVEALLPQTTGSGSDFRAGWLREMEFRTETEDFEAGKQEYLFRLSPSTPRIRRAQSRFIGLTREELDLNRLGFRAEVVKYVVEELLEIRRLQSELALQEDLLAVYEDEQTFLSRMVEEKGYNARDLLQAERASEELRLSIQANREYLDALIGDLSPPATSRLLSVPVLTARLASIDWYAIREALPSREQLDIARVVAETELEKAEQYRLVDFVQLRYNGPHSDLLQERLNVGVGLDLPVSAGKKLKLEELRVEKLLLEQEVTQQRTLDSLQVAAHLQTLQKLVNRRQLLTRDLGRQTGRLDRLRTSGVDAAYDSPDLFLFLQETVLRQRLDLLDLETDLYRAYLDLLEETGVLGREESLERGVLLFLLE